jgi:flagellar hook-length control protein FliK
MTAPVNTAPSVRAASGRPSDPSGADSAAPFASALDDVLAQTRAAERPAPSDRGAERSADRRRSPDQRADLADERAAQKIDRTTERLTDRAQAAARRAADKADRAAERGADSATDRAAGDAVQDVEKNAGEPTERPIDDAAGEVSDPASPGATAIVDPAPRGLPAALWALLTGAPLAATGQSGTGTGAAAAMPTPVQAPPTGDAIGASATAAALVPTATVPAAGAPFVPDTSVPVAAVAAADGLPAVGGAAAPTGEVAGPAVPLPITPSVAGPTGAGAQTPPGSPAESAETSAVPSVVVLRAAEQAAGSSVPAGGPEPAAAVGVVPVGPPSSPQGDEATRTAPVGGLPAGTVPTASAGTSGDPASADAGSPRPDGSAAPPLVDGVVETPSGGPVVAPTPVASGSVADVATTGDAAALPAGSQVARHVAVLRGAPDGRHTMTLVLTPESLGPVEVQVTVTKGSVDLTLRGAHEHGRAALLDSLPDLRRDLETAGLTCARLEVDRDTGGSRLSQQAQQQAQQQGQQGFGDRSGQPDRGDRSRPWLRAADITGSGPTPPSQRSTSSGVDVRV